MAENYFTTLNSINIEDEVKQKNNLSYLPWAVAWERIKTIHPDATYYIHERETEYGLVDYFTDGRTCRVKVDVTVNGITHTESLACMDFKNQAIPLEKITSVDVGKSIQRALTKACGRHGLGLYLYKGDDMPTGAKKAKKEKDEELTNKKNELIELMGTLIESGANKDDIYAIISKHNGGKKNPTTIDNIEVCEKAIADINKKYKEKK